MVDAQLADACWRSHVAEEAAAAAATQAKAEALEAHMVLRKAVAAHAAEVANDKRQAQEKHMGAWMTTVQASMEADVARWIRMYEEQLAQE
jgi:hypothetical protein